MSHTDPKNMYIFTALLEGLLVIVKQLCSQLYFISTINGGTDGLGWGIDCPCSLYPSPATCQRDHEECTPHPSSKMQKHVCNPGKPTSHSKPKIFSEILLVVRAINQPHTLESQISKGKQVFSQPGYLKAAGFPAASCGLTPQMAKCAEDRDLGLLC